MREGKPIAVAIAPGLRLRSSPLRRSLPPLLQAAVAALAGRGVAAAVVRPRRRVHQHRHGVYDSHQSRRPAVANRRRWRSDDHSPESRHESDRHERPGSGRRTAIACGVIVK